jgi:hypothetical protein
MKRQIIMQKFEEIFDMPYEQGLSKLRELLKKQVNFNKFTVDYSFDYSSVSMNERDFAIFAFFACLGSGFADVIDIKSLPSNI